MIPNQSAQFHSGLYVHKSGKIAIAFGVATQVMTLVRDFNLTPLNILAQHTEKPEIVAELYLSPERDLVFQPLALDVYMPGKWVAYLEPQRGRYWLRPLNMFMVDILPR